MKKNSNLALGRQGEELTASYLLGLGLKILTRNWRPEGEKLEIDLICEDGNTVVFVEVKTRRGLSPQSALESVGPVKRKRLVRAAAAYLSEQNLWERPCRFDIIGISILDEEFRLEHHRNAFICDFSESPIDWQPW